MQAGGKMARQHHLRPPRQPTTLRILNPEASCLPSFLQLYALLHHTCLPSASPSAAPQKDCGRGIRRTLVGRANDMVSGLIMTRTLGDPEKQEVNSVITAEPDVELLRIERAPPVRGAHNSTRLGPSRLGPACAF